MAEVVLDVISDEDNGRRRRRRRALERDPAGGVAAVDEFFPRSPKRERICDLASPKEPDQQDDDCLVLDGDPDEPAAAAAAPAPEAEEVAGDDGGGGGDGSDDLVVVVKEKGQLACRDYPHPRHLCAIFPFGTTTHETHCKMCHCYVCDTPAPCAFWINGISIDGHCHSTDKERKWKRLRKATLARRRPTKETVPPPVSGSSTPLCDDASSRPPQLAGRDYPHSRHLCAIFPFDTTTHETHCKMCHCYVCDTPAPCAFWINGVSIGGHCHSTDKEAKWKRLRKATLARRRPVKATVPPPVSGSSTPLCDDASSRPRHVPFSLPEDINRSSTLRLCSNLGTKNSSGTVSVTGSTGQTNNQSNRGSAIPISGQRYIPTSIRGPSVPYLKPPQPHPHHVALAAQHCQHRGNFAVSGGQKGLASGIRPSYGTRNVQHFGSTNGWLSGATIRTCSPAATASSIVEMSKRQAPKDAIARLASELGVPEVTVTKAARQRLQVGLSQSVGGFACSAHAASSNPIPAAQPGPSASAAWPSNPVSANPVLDENWLESVEQLDSVSTDRAKVVATAYASAQPPPPPPSGSLAFDLDLPWSEMVWQNWS